MPAKTKTRKKKQATIEEVSKDSLIGWKGGLRVDLDRPAEDGTPLRDKLSQHISTTLETELQNHKKLLANMRKWMRQYRGKKKSKSFPWPKSANVAIPVTRKNIDTVHVRLIDGIFNRRKVVICRAKSPEFVDIAPQIEEALDWLQRHVIRLKEKLLSPLFQATQAGTGVGKLVWESKKRTIYRYANRDERDDPNTKTYPLAGTTEKAVKDIQTVYEGPNIYPVDRSDFIVSSDATNIADSYLAGFRFYLRYPQVLVRVKQGLYDKSVLDAISQPDKFDANKEAKAETEGKELRKTLYEEPYELWELWLKYDVDDDGEEDDIVVVFHPASSTIFRAIYNPLFLNFRPFFRLVGYPLPYSFDGMGLCEAMEQLQEEIDSIHNQRLDRMSVINAPPTFTRAGIGLEDFKLAPGKNYEVETEIESAFKVAPLPDVFPSTFMEEDRLHGMASQVAGNMPELEGMSTSERPVAKETLARIGEANKKFKYFIDNYRMGIIEIFYMILEMIAQYQPTLRYKSEEGAGLIDKSVSFPVELLRDGLEIDLAASTEVLSQESRREVNLEIYTIMKDWMTMAGGMVQAFTSPQVPSEFKKYLIFSNMVGVEVLKRILRDFDVVDVDKLVADFTKVIDVKKALMMSVDLMPQQQGPPGGGPPGGGPPQQGPPQMGPPPMGR